MNLLFVSAVIICLFVLIFVIKFEKGLSRWLGISALISLSWALYSIIFIAKLDRFQSVPQKIFYIHVPSAWISFVAFFLVFIFSLKYLYTSSSRDDLLANSFAEVGVFFNTLVLITGPIWAKPIWGVWWTWDARLTTSLILWLLYVAYLMLRSYIDDFERRARLSAILGIFSFLNVPIVHYSVLWWRTLHPAPVVIRSGGMSDLPMSMHIALWSSCFSVVVLFIYLVRKRYKIGKFINLKEF